MDATPSIALPADASNGIVTGAPAALRVGPRTFDWGARTFVMGIVNVTPDSFSGDGLLARETSDPVSSAVEQARAMMAQGADLIDIGGQSTRPGHIPIDPAEERDRVVPVIETLRAQLPHVPISVDTTRADVAAAAIDAGADLVNDIWGVAAGDEMLALAAERGVPVVLMHNRAEARYRNVVAEVVADLERGVEAAVALGVAWENVIVDPGIGFGKTAEQNLAVLRQLRLVGALGRPVLVGTSRKSTIGKVLDLPAGDRLEGTLATTALAIQAGVDMVRVHDVEANVRVARMSDAIVRGGWTETGP